MTRHFGVFQFKPEITQAQIEESFACMHALVDSIEGLLSMEHGPYKSAEGLNDGYTHGFIMTFDSLSHETATFLTRSTSKPSTSSSHGSSA